MTDLIKPVSTAEDALSKDRSDYAAVDTETELISEVTPVPRLVCLQVKIEGQLYIVGYNDAKPFFRQVMEYALRTNRPITSHHTAFDTSVLLMNDPGCADLLIECYDRGLFEDSLLADKLDDIARGTYANKFKGRFLTSPKTGKRTLYRYGLSDTCVRRLGYELDKSGDTWRTRYAELRETPISHWPKAAVDYALSDVWHHHAVRLRQDQDEFRSPAREGVYVYADLAAQTRAGIGLQLCRWLGIGTDQIMTQRVVASLEKRQAAVINRLYEIGFVRRPKWMPRAKRWDDASTDETLVKKTLLARARAKNVLPKLAPKAEEDGVDPAFATYNQISIDAEALEIVDDPDLNYLKEHRKAGRLLQYTKILSTGFTHPIHSEPNTLVENGRISWGSDSPDGAGDDAKSVNLTNLPKEPGIRECYIPPRGYYIFAVDFSQLELCTVAQACIWLLGESTIAQLINEGVDLHTRLALIFLETKGIRLSVEQFKVLRDSEDIIYGHLTAEKIRDAAKRTNFGFLGGMGIDRFLSQNRDLKLLRDDVVGLKAAFMRGYPEMKPYFSIADNVAKSRIPQIVQFTSGRVRGGLEYCDTANTFFSGLAADGAKEALYKVQRAFYFDRSSPLFMRGGAFAFVHDEIVGFARQDCAHEVTLEAQRIMQETMQLRTPNVKISTSESLMIRWRKGAKAYYVNGRLTPFEMSPKFAELVAKGKMVPEPSFEGYR